MNASFVPAFSLLSTFTFLKMREDAISVRKPMTSAKIPTSYNPS